MVKRANVWTRTTIFHDLISKMRYEKYYIIGEDTTYVFRSWVLKHCSETAYIDWTKFLEMTYLILYTQYIQCYYPSYCTIPFLIAEGGRGGRRGSNSVFWEKYLVFQFITTPPPPPPPINDFFYQLLPPLPRNYCHPPNLWAEGQSIAKAMNPMLWQWKENTRISI